MLCGKECHSSSFEDDRWSGWSSRNDWCFDLFGLEGMEVKMAKSKVKFKRGSALTLAEVESLIPGDRIWHLYVKDGHVRIDEPEVIESNDGREVRFKSGYDFDFRRASRNIDPAQLHLYPAEVDCSPGDCKLFAAVKVG